MAEYIIIARIGGKEVRHLYDDASKALKRAQALTNKHIAIRIEHAGAALTMAELVARNVLT